MVLLLLRLQERVFNDAGITFSVRLATTSVTGMNIMF